MEINHCNNRDIVFKKYKQEKARQKACMEH